MTPEDRLPQVVRKLQEQGIMFAVVGGFAARYYRNDSRDTKDVDIAIDDMVSPAEFAKRFVESFGLNARTARKADLEGGPLFAVKNKSTPE